MKWLDESVRPCRADWSRSDQATTEWDLAEADYVDAELQKIIDGQIQIGGKKIDVADITIDCDEQSLFEDADVLNQIHPKLRRLLRRKLNTKHDTAKKQLMRQAQKAVEKDRVSKA